MSDADLKRPVVSIIVAMTENRVIGRDGGLPWRRLSDDLKRFKALTTGHPIIMGRKTYASLDGPLPNRLNIIVTRREDYEPEDEGVCVAHSVEEAIEMARREEPEVIFIAGGEEIYRQALPRTDRIYLTLVHTTIDDGDTFFPGFEDATWRLQEETERRPADERHDYPFTFRRYERR